MTAGRCQCVTAVESLLYIKSKILQRKTKQQLHNQIFRSFKDNMFSQHSLQIISSLYSQVHSVRRINTDTHTYLRCHDNYEYTTRLYTCTLTHQLKTTKYIILTFTDPESLVSPADVVLPVSTSTASNAGIT